MYYLKKLLIYLFNLRSFQFITYNKCRVNSGTMIVAKRWPDYNFGIKKTYYLTIVGEITAPMAISSL